MNNLIEIILDLSQKLTVALDKEDLCNIVRDSLKSALNINQVDIFIDENQKPDQAWIKSTIPLKIKGNPIGLILLGEKETGEPLTEDELTMLEILSNQIAIAVYNALLAKKINDFKVELKKEEEKATRKLKKINQKLRKIDKTKSEFISIASHQLRTPLTSIKGYTALLLEGSYGDVSEKQKEVMQKIYVSNERLIILVDDLLNISQMERGDIEYNFAEVDIKDLIKDIVSVMMIQAKSKNIYLKLKDNLRRLPSLMIKADAPKISEVIGNLIDNALKYTSKGGVTVSLDKTKHFVRIAVVDTGIGIEKSDMASLFEKFSRGKGIHKYHTGGTGLGLYVAKRLIAAHKGRIWAESLGIEKGASFFVELPLLNKATKANVQ